MTQTYLSVIIPAYKEEKRIHKILEAIIEYQKDHDFDIEVIVVLDGTPDDSLTAALNFQSKIKGLKVINRKENKGKGYSVKEGMLEASGKYRLFADADNSTPFDQVDKLIQNLTDDVQVAIGSRYIHGGGQKKKQPLIRRIGSRGINLIIRMLAVKGIYDTQCGFKLFSEHAAKEIFSRQTVDRWSFDIELLAIAKCLGYKIAEVPVVWNDDPHSTVSPLRDGLRMIAASWQIRKNIIKGLYK
jgi:glycosyltransferase involved in cell wall biosynthesis